MRPLRYCPPVIIVRSEKGLRHVKSRSRDWTPITTMSITMSQVRISIFILEDVAVEKGRIVLRKGDDEPRSGRASERRALQLALSLYFGRHRT